MEIKRHRHVISGALITGILGLDDPTRIDKELKQPPTLLGV
jgi:hypothetical protein